jgi:hypothetical protein
LAHVNQVDRVACAQAGRKILDGYLLHHAVSKTR